MIRRSIRRKNILTLLLLGIILLLGTGLAAGFQMYRQNILIYTDMAYSYVNLAAANIDGERILQLVEMENRFSGFSREFGEALDQDDMEKLMELSGDLEDDQNLYDLFTYYNDIGWFIYSGGNMSTSDIRYFYVVIPREDDFVYVWDSDTTGEQDTYAFEHAEYGPGEKENMMRVYRNEWDNILYISNEDGETLGTAMCPILDAGGDVAAVAAVDVSISRIRENFFRLLLHIAIAIAVIMLIAGAIYFVTLQKQILAPIVALEQATRRLVSDLESGTEGNFHVDVHTGDEIEVLAHSFEEMEQKLKAYISENAAITAEKERIGTELSLAERIQADMLPNVFPPFPDRNEFDIYASMKSAKEVGGDFYDFFLIDEQHLGLVMADVSGKGIPAALFMMMSKIMIQNYTMAGLSPKEVLETVNEQICKNNREQMFVTVWLGVLDLESGVLRASNAGHEYPIIKNPGKDYELIRDRHSFVIGGMEGVKYAEYELVLLPGSALFLYTDGLAEAADENDELFGTERILQTLNAGKEDTPAQVLEHMDQAVGGFVKDAPQFDDLTMLCLTYFGTEK